METTLEKNKVKYVSFGILNDLVFTHKKIRTFNTKDELVLIMKEFWNILLNESYLYWDYCKYSDEYTDKLLKYNTLCWNRVEKYYVVCFAINFEIFNIWSKDCDARVIDWTQEYEYENNFDNLTFPMQQLALEKAKKTIQNPPEDYNLNPVIKLINSYNAKFAPK